MRKIVAFEVAPAVIEGGEIEPGRFLVRYKDDPGVHAIANSEAEAISALRAYTRVVLVEKLREVGLEFADGLELTNEFTPGPSPEASAPIVPKNSKNLN